MDKVSREYSRQLEDEDYLRHKESSERISLTSRSGEALASQHLLRKRFIRLTDGEAQEKFKKIPNNQIVRKKEEDIRAYQQDLERAERREATERGREEGFRDVLQNVLKIVQLTTERLTIPQNLVTLKESGITTKEAQTTVDKQETIRQHWTTEKIRMQKLVDEVSKNWLIVFWPGQQIYSDSRLTGNKLFPFQVNNTGLSGFEPATLDSRSGPVTDCATKPWEKMNKYNHK